MANHDDFDIVRLFKLSTAEAAGLGLDLEESTEAAFNTGEIPARAVTPPAAEKPQQRERANKPVSALSLSDDLSEDIALIAMLEGGSLADFDTEHAGTGAARGLALAESQLVDFLPPTAPPQEPATTEDSYIERPQPVLHVVRDEQAPEHTAVADYGMSEEEALGFDLAPAESADAAETAVKEKFTSDLDSETADVDSAQNTPESPQLPAMLHADDGDERTEQGAAPEPEMTDIKMDAEPAVTPKAADTSAIPLDFDAALLEAFAEESAELLDSMHVELEHLESDLEDHGAMLEIRRVVHTLKGGAKMCGFERVVTLTHSCENLLDLIAAGTASLDATTLRALFACEPLLRATVQDALAGTGEADIEALTQLAAHFDALCTAIEAPLPDGHGEPVSAVEDIAAAAPLHKQEESEGKSLDMLAVEDVTEHAAENSVHANSADILDASTPLLEPVVAPETTPTATPESRASSRRSSNSINVDLAKVDAVVAKVSEMAAHRASYQVMIKQLMETAEEARRNAARLNTLVAQMGNETSSVQEQVQPERNASDDLALESYGSLNSLMLQIQEAVSDQQALVQRVHDTITMHWRLRSTESRVDADLQSALMNIRLIPLATMRVRLDGIVRQTAQTTGKTVRWQLHGGNVAVEKNVFDRLFEPLMHLLRNAIDHGLETSSDRRAAGKSETGMLTVSAKQENNQIVIAVSDDGAGIAPDKIAALAIERGVITADQAATMNSTQKTNLIFTPGFSTANAVSHLSGRGVGMDAVHEACLRMGGAVDVASELGAGTIITMRLPLSLSVTRGLIVRDSGHLMAIPVAQINALHLVSVNDVVETPEGSMARLEGIELPIFNLPPLAGTVRSSYVQNDEVHVLQIPRGEDTIGILIEDVLDEEEILIKAPPPFLHAIKTILGAYTLSDGNVAPVLNLPQILSDLRPVMTLVDAAEHHEVRELTALIVDDSMSMRVALSGTLQNAGFRVLTARDGQEALDVLQREGLPRLIMLDVEMPRMDGLETLFAIRHLPGAQNLPVFMMTSRGGASHRRAAEQLGATRYFTKPYRDSELAAAARMVCVGAAS